MNYNDNIGEIITEHRKKINMSQNTLAKKLFVTRQAVSNWENGKTKPDISVIFKLCQILNIDIKTIIDLDDDLKIENIIKAEKKKTNRRNLLFTSVIIIIFFAIIATLIIVFNRNSFAVYNVYLDSNEFELNNSLIIKSKVKNYFQFGTLVSNLDNTDEDTVYNIKIYKKNDTNKRLIFEQTYHDNLFISENYGYGEYFDDYNAKLDNLYLEISFIENDTEQVYDYKLRVEENFKSNSIVYLKDEQIGNITNNISNEEEVSAKTLLDLNYEYNDNLDCFVKNIADIKLSYYPTTDVINYKKEEESRVILITYFPSQERFKLTVYDMLTNDTIDNSFTLNNIDNTYEEYINYILKEYKLIRGN